MDSVDEESPAARAKKETLAIPQLVRDEVDARDGTFCRGCGKYLGNARALHHVNYGGDVRGMGGRRLHRTGEIVTLCWIGPLNCHDMVHQNKSVWQPLLREVVVRRGVTAMQLRRWQKNGRGT